MLAFPFFDNHINKDASIYLSYNKVLEKDENLKPIDKSQWDKSTFRVYLTEFILGMEKYSPSLDLTKLKVQVNLVYDQFNNGDSGLAIRPYPELETPKKDYKYYVMYNNLNYGSFLTKEKAEEYMHYLLEKMAKKKTDNQDASIENY